MMYLIEFFINLKMYNITKLKILVIGPEASGKTTIVNYLA